MAKVELLAKCPGLRQVLDGRLNEWSKDTPEVIAAHRWAIANNQALAAMTANHQRIHGYQFTPKTYRVAAFDKLLAMAGVEAAHAGQVGRVHHYRRQTVGDIQQAIARAQEKGRNDASLQRHLYRAQHQTAVVEAAQAAVMTATEASAIGWANLTGYLAQNFSDERSTTEVLCTPDLSPGDRVRLAGKNGWAGLITSIESAAQAFVQWFGDPCPSLVPLDALEVLANAA
jgi:hypothetical protein